MEDNNNNANAMTEAPLRSPMVDDSVEESVDSEHVNLLATSSGETTPEPRAAGSKDASTVVTPSEPEPAAVTEPEPAVTEPAATEPAVTEPDVIKPEPAVTEPAATPPIQTNDGSSSPTKTTTSSEAEVVPATPPSQPKGTAAPFSTPPATTKTVASPARSSPGGSSVKSSPGSSHRRSAYKPYALSPSTPVVETRVVFLGDITEKGDAAAGGGLLGIGPRLNKEGEVAPVDLSMTTTPEKSSQVNDSVLTMDSEDALNSPAWKGGWTDATTAAATGAAVAAIAGGTVAAAAADPPPVPPNVASMSPLTDDTGSPPQAAAVDRQQGLDKGLPAAEDKAASPPPAVVPNSEFNNEKSPEEEEAVEAMESGENTDKALAEAPLSSGKTDPETPDKEQDETEYYDASQDNLESQKAAVVEAQDMDKRKRRRCYTRLAALLLFILLIILLPVLLVKRGNDSLEEDESASMSPETTTTTTTRSGGPVGDDTIMSPEDGDGVDDPLVILDPPTTNSTNSTTMTPVNATTGTGKTTTTPPAAAPTSVPAPTAARTANPTPEVHFEGPGAFLGNGTLHATPPQETNVTTPVLTNVTDTMGNTTATSNETMALVGPNPPDPGRRGPGSAGGRASRGINP